MANMTQSQALRAVAERINWQGDDGLRDSVLEALDPQSDTDGQVGAEPSLTDGQLDDGSGETSDSTTTATGRRRASNGDVS